ncbi:MAG TPA: single-stranded-DNA-specific exonuclease RecJ [Candidatus Limnocylindrales bacterium]|nr:single-stranded-DNA-specific exonuclease RecJ [Candidatus Limnocylindrales bacterium]
MSAEVQTSGVVEIVAAPVTLRARRRWTFPAAVPVPDAVRPVGAAHGLGERVLALLAARGIDTADALSAFLAEPLAALHDPALLPDASALVARVRVARDRREPVVVFGDFDADGLTGLAILARALRSLGLTVEPYVPSREDEGHGLSLGAIDAAERVGSRLIVTVDTGSTSGHEIEAAATRGVDVVVTDHHRVPPVAPPALALVNPHRPDASYPDRRLSGAGVAFKVAQLLARELEPAGTLDPLALADLAAIGTVADLAPVLGENRAIARLGLDRLRGGGQVGLRALLARAGVAAARADLETIAFAIAPRLNAAGRVGDAADAARLLLTDDPAEAESLAERLDAANGERRDLTRSASADARGLVDGDGHGPVVVRGTWPVGIIGLVASRLVDETGRAAVVATESGGVLRASCRSGGELDLAAALEACADLFVRHGGHPGAAGFEIEPERWDAFRERFALVAESLAAPGTAPGDGDGAGGDHDDRRPLRVDLALPPSAVDYALLHDLGRLEPTGPGHPPVLVAIAGLTVVRVRAANGGHTQLTLRRDPDVLDAVAFNRDDLVGALVEGMRVDVVARLASRTFGGFESIQLEVRDVAAHRAEPSLVAALSALGGATGTTASAVGAATR